MNIILAISSSATPFSFCLQSFPVSGSSVFTQLLFVFWSWWCVCVWACVFWGYDYFSVLARHHELCLGMWPSQMFHTSFKCRDDFSMYFYFSTRHRGISLLFSLVFLLNADGFHWYPLAQNREFCCSSLWLLLKVANRLFTVQKPIKKQGWWEGKLALFWMPACVYICVCDVASVSLENFDKVDQGLCSIRKLRRCIWVEFLCWLLFSFPSQARSVVTQNFPQSSLKYLVKFLEEQSMSVWALNICDP